MTETEFDWQPLGQEWWAEAGKQIGATPKQVRFACARHRGCSATESARQAGYEATEDGLRSTGYRVSRSNVVAKLLAFASAEGPDGTVDRDEARRVLSSLIRGSDPSVRIRAIEQLNKMDEADSLAREQAEAANETPTSILDDIAALSPEVAAPIATIEGVRPGYWPESITAEARAKISPLMEQLARNWISDNAQEAKTLAEFWLRPNPFAVSNVIPIRPNGEVN